MPKTFEQTKNNVYLVVSVVALLLAAVSITTIVTAAEGSADYTAPLPDDETAPKKFHGLYLKDSPLRQVAADNDFEEFQSILIEKGKDPKKISEENFNKLVEAHNLRLAGDNEGSRAILQELKSQHKGEFDGEKHKRFFHKYRQWHKYHQPEN